SSSSSSSSLDGRSMEKKCCSHKPLLYDVE
ncbi:unnamed protein product, partial [Rotaria magnacalcarata]